MDIGSNSAFNSCLKSPVVNKKLDYGFDKIPLLDDLNKMLNETNRINKVTNEITPYLDSFTTLANQSNTHFSNFNYDKTKNLSELHNTKQIFTSTNKEKAAIKNQNMSNLNFKITKDKETKEAKETKPIYTDFSEQFKIQSNRIATLPNLNNPNVTKSPIESSDFQIPSKNLNQAYTSNDSKDQRDLRDLKFNEVNTFPSYITNNTNKHEKRDKRFKTIDGTSNFKYLMGNFK